MSWSEHFREIRAISRGRWNASTTITVQSLASGKGRSGSRSADEEYFIGVWFIKLKHKDNAQNLHPHLKILLISVNILFGKSQSCYYTASKIINSLFPHFRHQDITARDLRWTSYKAATTNATTASRLKLPPTMFAAPVNCDGFALTLPVCQ